LSTGHHSVSIQLYPICVTEDLPLDSIICQQIKKHNQVKLAFQRTSSVIVQYDFETDSHFKLYLNNYFLLGVREVVDTVRCVTGRVNTF
jgi:hypothetical protein